MNSKRVVVAVLDWGLGHATRCIPIIESLQNRDCEVLIASSGSALALLRKEFPDLKYFELPSYNVVYSEKMPFIISILFQIPKILKVIATEYLQMKGIIVENKIDLVISDNRYGCWSETVKSVFVCHQLNIQLPWMWRWAQPVINFLHRRRIRRFSECWIPDDSKINLSGELSKSSSFPVKYVGILSRLRKQDVELKYDIAVVLSGPEPQRTKLEKIVSRQLFTQNWHAVVVRGVLDQKVDWTIERSLSVVNYLPTKELEEVINQSKLIIARSGYSTIMDLARLGKKAILIPTPGQTEQEYLAKRLTKAGICYSVSQQNFDLTTALTEANSFSGFSNIEPENELLSKALDEVLK